MSRRSPHLEQADVILSLDADFLAEGPGHLQHARGFAVRRRLSQPAATDRTAMNRLYVVESTTTLTGAAADNRLPLSPRGVAQFALACARELGLESLGRQFRREPPYPPQWLTAVVEDLQAARGRSLVIVGRSQPPIVHALAHWMNQTLGNVGTTVEYRAPIAARPELHDESIRALAAAMQSDEVKALLILGGNPVYDAPANLNFAAALRKVPFSAHLSLYQNETSTACQWHVPATHLLESWSDTRGPDGTASIVQPLIAPLFDGKTAHELLAALAGQPQMSAYEIVRDYWRQRHGDASNAADGNFDDWWKTALHDGIVAGTASPSSTPSLRTDFAAELADRVRVRRCRTVRHAADTVFPARSVGVGRPIRQQRLAAGIAAAVHEAHLGQCRACQPTPGRRA